MDQTTADSIIESYDALREKCYRIAKASPEEIMGEDAWLSAALGVGDMLIAANSDGVNCWGLTYTTQTWDNESFNFTIPYDLLGD